MAKISVTDDQGTLIEQFTDEGEEIGNLDRPMAKSSLINQIAHAVSRARSRRPHPRRGADLTDR